MEWDGTYEIPQIANIVVNATSIGMHPNADEKLDFKISTLSKNMIAADVVINLPMINFMKDAGAKGCKVLNGFGMVVNQGVPSVKYWTGVDVSPEVMHERLLQVL